MTIVATESVSVFFQDVVEDAMRVRKVDASEAVTRYLVALLSDYAHPHARSESMDRPLAFMLDEALHTPAPGDRFDKLRLLGDGVLYQCGYFGDHFAARGVDRNYLVGIGTTAYNAASSMLRVPHRSHDKAPVTVDIYGELAGNFPVFVEVIAEVANVTIAKEAASPKGLLKLYERWLKTKSESLGHALSAHGFVASGGGRGTLQ